MLLFPQLSSGSAAKLSRNNLITYASNFFFPVNPKITLKWLEKRGTETFFFPEMDLLQLILFNNNIFKGLK